MSRNNIYECVPIINKEITLDCKQQETYKKWEVPEKVPFWRVNWNLANFQLEENKQRSKKNNPWLCFVSMKQHNNAINTTAIRLSQHRKLYYPWTAITVTNISIPDPLIIRLLLFVLDRHTVTTPETRNRKAVSELHRCKK